MIDTKQKHVRKALKNISTQDFLNFGRGQVAYIRPVNLPDNDDQGFGVFGADGELIDVLPSYHSAIAALYQQELDYARIQ